MHHRLLVPARAPRRFARHAAWRLAVLCLAVLWEAGVPSIGMAQDQPPLQITGLNPTGVRGSATQDWGVLSFNIVNRSDVPRRARVVVSFTARPDDQYSRDVWAPPHTTLSSWVLTGPAPIREGAFSTEIEVLLYDTTDGTERLILPPTEERIRSRLILARKRESSTTVMADEPVVDRTIFGQLPQPPTLEDDIYEFLRVFRAARGHSEVVNLVQSGPLPPIPEAFESVDHFVLASNRIAADPVGMRALRQWLQRGGRVWVMLDLVRPDVVRALLGDDCDFQVIDRVSLTTTKIESVDELHGAELPLAQDHERPVDLVRVVTTPTQRIEHTVNGWPAWFSRDVGLGKVVFTTLGGRGWSRPRAKGEKSPFASFATLPVPLVPFLMVAEEVDPPEAPPQIAAASLQPLLTDEIGYAVVDRGVVMAVFGFALGGVLVLGLLLRNFRRPELIGWLGPAAALAATVAFFVAGESSRRAATPTVAVAQVVHGTSGKAEAAVSGVLALYRADSGDARLEMQRGGMFELDLAGLQGQTRRLIQTDMDAWRWENLSLPAGVRFAPFRTSVTLDQPLTAVARFGPGGVEGHLKAGPFEKLEDALLRTPNGRNLALTVGDDGAFTASSADALPTGQFITGAVVSDAQRRRQDIYRGLAPTEPKRQVRTSALLAWARPLDLGFRLGEDLRQTGSALIVAPFVWQRTPPGQQVRIPGSFVRCRRLLQGRETWITTESSVAADMELRFQLPAEVLPLEVERARFTAKIAAASRRVTLAGMSAPAMSAPVELHRVESPLGAIEVDIDRPELLKLDAEGGLLLHLSISDFLSKAEKVGRADGSAEVRWHIEFIELDVAGRTLP